MKLTIKILMFVLLGLNIAFYGMAQQIPTQQNIQIAVVSSDLSEDMSLSSTKNDELLILIYKIESDSGVLGNLAYQATFTLDRNQMSKHLNWQADVSDSIQYLYFLLEMDSDNTSIQLDPVLRIYYKEVIQCFTHRDYVCIEKYLLDEDILDYNYFVIPSEHTRKGVYKLDRYQYSVRFTYEK